MNEGTCMRLYLKHSSVFAVKLDHTPSIYVKEYSSILRNSTVVLAPAIVDVVWASQ